MYNKLAAQGESQSRNQAGGAALPLPQHVSLARGTVRVAIAAAVGLTIVLLVVRYDLPINGWVTTHPGFISEGVLAPLRVFGNVVPAIAISVVIARLDSRRGFVIAAIWLTLFLAWSAQGLIKVSVVRYRPNAPEIVDAAGLTWRDSWNGVHVGLRPVEQQSFPSGHSAAAFAFAAVLAWFYPALRPLLYVLATGCAASRVLNQVHWASDCVAGAAIGYLAGWLTLRPYAWVLPIIWWNRCRRQRRRRNRCCMSASCHGRHDESAVTAKDGRRG